MKNKPYAQFALSLVMVLLALVAARRPALADSARMAGIRLVSDTQRIEPGNKFRLGLLFTISEGSHIYWKNPGDAGLATRVEWKLPEGFVAGPLFWPAPVRLEEPGDLSVNAYTDSVMLFSWVQAPPKFKSGEVTLGVQADWLACRKICVQEADSAGLILATGDAQEKSSDFALFEHYASLVPRPAANDGRISGNARWTGKGGNPEERTGVLTMVSTAPSPSFLNDSRSAVFFGDPSMDVTCESFHLDTDKSTPGLLVMHIRVRALRGREWPDTWGGVLSARAQGPEGDTLTLALQYSLPGRIESNP